MGRIHDALRKAAEEREAKLQSEARRSTQVPEYPSTSEAEAPELEPAPRRPASPPVQRDPRCIPLDMTLPGEMEIPPAPGTTAMPRRPEPARRPEPTRPAERAPEEAHDRTPGRAASTVNPFAPSIPETKSVRRRIQSSTTVRRTGFLRRKKADKVGSETARTRTPGEVDERVVVFHSVRDERAERFRVLRSNLTSLSPRPHRILITSTTMGEGKSLVVANLAAALAEKGGPRVLLVDANLRHPELADLFTLRRAPGVTEYLEGAVRGFEGLIQSTGIPGVDLLPAGESPANPGALWIYHALRTMLAEVPSSYDYVLVDTPAIDDYADASVMAPDADGTLLVVKVGDSGRSQVEHAIRVLEASQGRVLGAFATNAR